MGQAAAFEDGQALFDTMCDRGLEGIVAKRLGDPYRPGGRTWWIKTKNRSTLRFAEELAGATAVRRHRLASRSGERTVSVSRSRLGRLSGWCRCSLLVTQREDDPAVCGCLASDLSG